MAPVAELVSPTFVLSATGQYFVLGCHSPAAMDKTQHGSHKVELLFESLTQTVPHNTEIWLGLWRPWWQEMEAHMLTQLSSPSHFYSKQETESNYTILTVCSLQMDLATMYTIQLGIFLSGSLPPAYLFKTAIALRKKMFLEGLHALWSSACHESPTVFHFPVPITFLFSIFLLASSWSTYLCSSACSRWQTCVFFLIPSLWQ